MISSPLFEDPPVEPLLDCGEVDSPRTVTESPRPRHTGRRLRTLLFTAPIHELDANKSRRGDEWLAYDLRSLQLAAIETVVDRMGLEGGVGRAVVRAALAELAGSMAPQHARDLHLRVADVVIGWLLNEDEATAGFQYSYSEPSDRSAIKQQVQVELLREVQMADGSLLIKATPGAINLLIGALDVDVADAQKAEERILEEYIAAGRFEAAEQIALRARFRSIQYAETIRTAIDQAQLDLSRLDWAGHVLEEISAAQAHVAGRLQDEGRMRYRLDDMRLSSDNSGQLSTIDSLIDLIDDCHTRHTVLHSQLMRASDVFLAEQARQRLAPPPSLTLVSLSREVLDPLLQLSDRIALDLTSDLFLTLLGIQVPFVLDLSVLADEFLAPRREYAEEELRAYEFDPLPADMAEPAFRHESLVAVRDLFASLAHRPMRVSELLSLGRVANEPFASEVCELIRLEVLRAFAPSADSAFSDSLAPAGTISIRDQKSLEDARFGGDDLLVMSSKDEVGD